MWPFQWIWPDINSYETIPSNFPIIFNESSHSSMFSGACDLIYIWSYICHWMISPFLSGSNSHTLFPFISLVLYYKHQLWSSAFTIYLRWYFEKVTHVNNLGFSVAMTLKKGQTRLNIEVNMKKWTKDLFIGGELCRGFLKALGL